MTRHKPLCVNRCTLRLPLECLLLLELDLNLLPVFIQVRWEIGQFLLLFLGQASLEDENLQRRQSKKRRGACGTWYQREGEFLTLSQSLTSWFVSVACQLCNP